MNVVKSAFHQPGKGLSERSPESMMLSDCGHEVEVGVDVDVDVDESLISRW